MLILLHLIIKTAGKIPEILYLFLNKGKVKLIGTAII